MTIATAHLDEAAKKSSGAHYTPSALAAFLACAILNHAAQKTGIVNVLDPACGDGSLLEALAIQAEPELRARLNLVGFETDELALQGAEQRLAGVNVASVDIRHGDFLEAATAAHEAQLATGLFASSEPDPEHCAYDIIISNPPYVRTQVLGADRAQVLAQQFGLTGRVDLYHAFVVAMKAVLADGGMLGLLTSNRFMLIQSGAAMRRVLRSDFRLHEIYDLGDTKLFEAAVLPAIVIAERTRTTNGSHHCEFVRVYESRRNGVPMSKSGRRTPVELLPAIASGASGSFAVNGNAYDIQRGTLVPSKDPKLPWALISADTERAMETIGVHQHAVFNDVGRIRVGIKTTADKVFIRDDWDALPPDHQPEADLLHPLITHHVAGRWFARSEVQKQVLYPHEGVKGERKQSVDISQYPAARRYLEDHREQLESRKYVIQAGRQWYEIWVPQHPADWEKPKVVFPDITESGRFFFDQSGAIVNGDCYWITLRNGFDLDWLYMLLAIGNSTFIDWYYDALYHNKLYAGRRRFMTQYVKQFPLPELQSAIGSKIVEITKQLVEPKQDQPGCEQTEVELNRLVWSAFGLNEITTTTQHTSSD